MNQTAKPDTGMKVESMSGLDYIRLGMKLRSLDCSTQEDRRTCESLQKHFEQRYDKYGGIAAFHRLLIELGIDPSSLVIPGMPLKEWCNDSVVVPINDFGVEMAKHVNKMTGAIKAAIADEGSDLGQLFFKAFHLILDDKILSSEDGVWSQAFQLVMKYKTRFPAACQTVMGTKSWVGLMAVVMIAVGVMMRGRVRRPGGREVLNSGTTEDDDDDDGDHVDGSETDAGDDGDNEGDQGREQLNLPMCRVTLDEPSGAHRWEWGHVCPGEQNMRVTPEGQEQYQVYFPMMKVAGWFRADQVAFPDGETFHRHDLRKRVKV